MRLASVHPSLPALNRFAAAIFGGYVFAYGFVALSTLFGFGLGLGFFEAETLSWLLSFLVYLGVLLWAFVPGPTWVVWLVLGGGGSVMGAAAWMLSRVLF